MTWRTFRQNLKRRRLSRLRALERRSDLHGQRLDAQGRTLEALASRIGLADQTDDRQDSALTEVEARIADLEDQARDLKQRLVALTTLGGGTFINT